MLSCSNVSMSSFSKYTKHIDCIKKEKVLFVGDSLIAELFIGLGDIFLGNTTSINFKNWVERWTMAHKYNNYMKINNFQLECTKYNECYNDISNNCMSCIKKNYEKYNYIIYGNYHIINKKQKWNNILHPIRSIRNAVLVTHPIIENYTLSKQYYQFIKKNTKHDEIRILDWYQASNNNFGKKERLDNIHSNRILARKKALFLLQRICPTLL